MTTFLDGPAAGVTLRLRRSPVFLRVTRAEGGKGVTWDALDQIADEPRWNETIFVYERVADHGVLFTRPGGCSRMAEYKYLDPQPDRAVMYHKTKWQAWATERMGER